MFIPQRLTNVSMSIYVNLVTTVYIETISKHAWDD